MKENHPWGAAFVEITSHRISNHALQVVPIVPPCEDVLSKRLGIVSAFDRIIHLGKNFR